MSPKKRKFIGGLGEASTSTKRVRLHRERETDAGRERRLADQRVRQSQLRASQTPEQRAELNRLRRMQYSMMQRTGAMESARKMTTRAVGAERQRDEHPVHERNELRSAGAMESACKMTTRAVGAERQRDEQPVHERNELRSAGAMESACKMTTRAVGAERQRDEQPFHERNECPVTCSANLEASGEVKAVSGEFGDVCCMCGGRLAFPDHQTEYFIRNKDEVCCHLCQMKFYHMSSLASHLKTTHSWYHMLCKSCSMYKEQRVVSEWTVQTDKTPKKEPLDEEVEEVIIENEEVEIKFVKEEEEEVVVGRVEETEENRITKTQEDSKMVSLNFHDHTYFSPYTCSSVKETTSNAVMYTSSEKVLVFVNNKDTNLSPEDSYTESDQQGTPVEDQTVCGVMHDHIYFSTQSLANPMLLEKQVSVRNTCRFFGETANNVINSSTENIHMCNNEDTRMSPNDPESTESDQDQTWYHDHTYFSRESCSNCEFVPIQEDVLVGEYEVIIQTSDHGVHESQTDDLVYTSQDDLSSDTTDTESLPTDDLVYTSQDDLSSDTTDTESLHTDDLVYTSQDDLSSDTMDGESLPTDDLVCTSHDDLSSDKHVTCCTSTDSSCKTKSWSACKKKNCENTTQTSLGTVDSVNPNPATSLYKDVQICTSCGLSKVPKAKNSMDQFTCTPFICCLCGIMFGTEGMLLNHLAEKHPLTKYVCERCLQLFPNQNVFIQHICSKSKGFSGESLTLSKISNNIKEPSLTIPNRLPSPAAAESSKQPVSVPRPNIINTAPNLNTVLNSTSHSLSNSPFISTTPKVPVQVMTTRSSSCAEKKVACLVSNGDQGQVTTPISTVTPKQIGQEHSKVVTQTSSSSSSSQILHLSSQGLGQKTPTSTVPQAKSGQLQHLTPLQTKLVTHTPTGNAQLMSSIVLTQQHPSFGVHVPPPILSQVSSSVSVTSQTGQLPESNVPFLDFCRSLSTMILPSSQGPSKIVAMFVNRSKELALEKRMCQSWRTKAVFPCRQCGAVSRQFSLGVRHRYQHRGPRIHRCQCGRAFQQRMHLLRHQVQHAEATRYVCAACGQMFCGTQQLACHRPLFRITSSNRKKKVSKECRNMFRCYCGHSFTRPAALLWHMLKNSKARKPRLKGFRLT